MDKAARDAREWRESHAIHRASSGGISKGSVGASASASSQSGAVAPSEALPGVSVAMARKVYPPGAVSLYFEKATERIRVQYSIGGEKWCASASVHADGGEEAAVIYCLRWAWQYHVDLGGDPPIWPQLK